MKKILFLTNFSSPEERCYSVTNFSRAAYEAALLNDLEFHINTNNEEVIYKNEDATINFHVVEVYRNPFSKNTWKAYKQLMKVLSEEEFDIIHCNTPIGGVLGRICGKKKKINKIIYQVHGFHFYKGAPKLNWLIYYPLERLLAHFTDFLITINKEDFEIAKKFRLKKNGKVCYVPGVGIDLSLYSKQKTNSELRTSLGLKADDFICIGIGRIEENKNYESTIRAIEKTKNSKVHLLICGEGMQKNYLLNLVKSLGIENQIHFLGYRSDIKELLLISDCYISTSKREGLPRALMEAMACGLPCIVSSIRGNVDLICEGKNGYVVPLENINEIANDINKLITNNRIRDEMKNNNLIKIKNYSLDKIIEMISNIYKD